MAQSTRASSVPHRYAPTSGQRDRMPNTADYRFADLLAGNGARPHFLGGPAIVHRLAVRGLFLRRVAARRRVARIDPEAVERRARRLLGDVVNSPMRR